jgi:hypothetical protein
VAGLVLGIGGLVGVRKLKKRDDGSPDYEAMAQAWFAAKEDADIRHRNAIVHELQRVGEKLDKVVDAIHESNAIVREANEKTRERVADLVAKALKLST